MLRAHVEVPVPPSPPPNANGSVSTWWTVLLAGLLCAFLLLGLLGAVRQGQIGLMEASAGLVLGCLTVSFSAGFTNAVRSGDWPRLETSWGGLGGGLGGWRVSPSLAWLAGLLTFGAAFTFLALQATRVDQAEPPPDGGHEAAHEARGPRSANIPEAR